MRFRCQHFGLMKYHLFVQFVPAQDLAELIDSGFLKVVVVADFDFAEVFALWVVALDYPNLKNPHWNRCLVRHCQASLNQDPDSDSPDNDEQGNDSNEDSSDLDSQEQQPREQRPQQNQSQRQPQPSRNQNQSAQPNPEPVQTEQINDTSLDQNAGSESAKPQPKKPFNMGLGVGSYS